jgi:hypothetical protein
MWIPTQNLTGHLSGLATNRDFGEDVVYKRYS